MPTGSFQQFVIGFTLLVVATLSAILVGWQGGMLMDGFYNNTAGYIPQAVITPIQGNSVYQGMHGLGVELYFVNLFWALDFFMGLLGVFLFWQGLVKYQSSEGYGAIGGGGGDTGGMGRTRMRRRRNR